MQKKTTLKITYCGLFAGVIAVCSFVSLPSVVPFTLQTMGVFLAFFILGTEYGTISTLTYLLLGATGLPVFSGFKGGIGVLFSQTGGFLWGFLVAGVILVILEKIFKKPLQNKIITGVIILLITYFSGTAWYVFAYGKGADFISVLKICVIPFVIPDFIKLFVAFKLSKRVKSVDLNK